jgi:type II secretory pathway pseudopilin PulG
MNLHKIKDKLPSSPSNVRTEGGFTIVEAMVAAIVIVLILLATAQGLSGSFKTSANNENANKASQLANEVIAIAKQAPYRQLYVAEQTTDIANIVGPGKCAETGARAGNPSGTRMVTSGDGPPFTGLVYCQAKRFGSEEGIGTTFYVQTTVAYMISTTSADLPSSGTIVSQDANYVSGSRFYPKRVYVRVFWKDAGSGAGTSFVREAYTRTPSSSECISDRIALKSTTPPPGCYTPVGG